MSKATEPEPTDANCACTFYLDPDIHDRLLNVESLPPLEAIELVGELAMCELQDDFEPGDFTRFVAEHNWNDPAAVARMGILLDDLAAGYCRH